MSDDDWFGILLKFIIGLLILIFVLVVVVSVGLFVLSAALR